MLPVPEKRSSTFDSSKSILFDNTLNSASFAKSVVGRAGNPAGGLMNLPLNFPPIMRNVKVDKVDNIDAEYFAQMVKRLKEAQ